MAEQIDTGGPAFPIVGTHEQVLETGMTLRDYFAAKAMQGMLADAQNPDASTTAVSYWAYRHADEMLRARKAAQRD